jgi:hypothetical protein
VAPFAAIAAIVGYAIYRARRRTLRHRPVAEQASPEN